MGRQCPCLVITHPSGDTEHINNHEPWGGGRWKARVLAHDQYWSATGVGGSPVLLQISTATSLTTGHLFSIITSAGCLGQKPNWSQSNTNAWLTVAICRWVSHWSLDGHSNLNKAIQLYKGSSLCSNHEDLQSSLVLVWAYSLLWVTKKVMGLMTALPTGYLYLQISAKYQVSVSPRLGHSQEQTFPLTTTANID